MYRLLKNASSTVNNVGFNNLGISQSFNSCTLCNNGNLFLSGLSFPSNIVFRRNLNSEEMMRLQNSFKKGKKYKKFKKKYTELLEIKTDRSKVTKAAVRNLSPKDISQLTQKPELSLENLHLSLQKSKTPLSADVTVNLNENCDNLFNQANLFPVNDEDWENKSEAEIELDLIGRNTENIDMFSDATSELHTNLIPNFISVDPVPLKTTKRKKKASLNPSKTNNTVSLLQKPKKPSNRTLKALANRVEEDRLKDLELKNRNRILQEFLSSYIEACVHCDFLTLAYNTIYRHLNKHKFSNTKIIDDVEPFNKLIHGYSRKGNIDKIMELLRMITSCNVDFDLQTFIGCFECLSILPETAANKEKQEIILKQFSAHGFTFQDLLTKGIFVKDQREKILNLVQKIDSNFVLYYDPPIQNYSCSLLQHLNNECHQWRSPAETVLTHDELLKFSNDQMRTELQTFQKINSVAKPATINAEIRFFRRKWSKLENEWRLVIGEAFDKNLKNLEVQLNNTKLCYNVNVYPYFKLLNHEEYVDIIITEINKLLRGSETYSSCLKTLHIEIGEQVRLRYDIKQQKENQVIDKVTNMYVEYCKWYLNPASNPNSQNTRLHWLKLLHENAGVGPSITNSSTRWPTVLLRNIGRFLYNIVINELKIDVNILSANGSNSLCTVSAFNELPRTHGKYIREEIKPHPIVSKLYRKACLEDLCFNIDLLPMVSPPIPWISSEYGGYLFKKAHFVRLFNSVPNAIVDTPEQKLIPVFDSLNQLSSVPWRINIPILDLMLKVFVKGGSEKLNIPQPASAFDIKSMLSFDGKKVSKPSYTQQLFITRRKGEMHSLWCEALYRLSLANHYRDYIIWLPHNMDFRGRVYPVPPHLAHIGSDMARALLYFAKGEKLGPKGLDWLKIHCINLTGLKKRSATEDRLKYANEILTDILDSAENPLTGKMWWAESEDLWQTLACCIEIKNAIESGDPENYVSHFPVHQDGSCNGLQHYAALGRDVTGGESVNLLPRSVPQDVYSCVVALVEEERLKDAANGNNIALALEGVIKRKIIKQTVMTTVYGVTKYGARLQIAKQLKEDKDKANHYGLEARIFFVLISLFIYDGMIRLIILNSIKNFRSLRANPLIHYYQSFDVEDFPSNLVWSGSLYLVSKTFYCLREMFTSAKKIQDWFTDCAKVISLEKHQCVEWETPLGLRVIQPYMKTKSLTVLNECNPAFFNLKPNGMKQKNAFPPNFIHSLDSSHMMLTSIMSEREGITFVSVHDCFWTHPSSVNVMGKICREQFVALHSEPVLEDLSQFFIRKYANNYCVKDENGSIKLVPGTHFEIFQQIPERGDMNLKDVLRSEFFFS